MQDLIVLGLIPGTNIQIGFIGWLLVAAIILAVRIVFKRVSEARAMRFFNKQFSLVLAKQHIPRAATRIQIN
ncbi:MAG TPA: hypothetical protein VLG47_02965 [Candidatus Saccharimonadales bacterium]|nr:hypothetical protein [Candidatus Saccharimonadales bacterium]